MRFDLLFNYLSQNGPILRLLGFAAQTTANVLERLFYRQSIFTNRFNVHFSFFPRGLSTSVYSLCSLIMLWNLRPNLLRNVLKSFQLSISINKYVCIARVRSLLFKTSRFGWSWVVAWPLFCLHIGE